MLLKGKNVAIGLLCIGLLTGCGEKEEKVESQSATEVTTTETEKQNSNKEKSTEEAPKFFNLLEEKLPYLDGTFDSENAINSENIDTFSASGNVSAFDVIEEDDKVEIIWATRDEDNTNVSVYRTVSNKDSWDKSQKLGTFKLQEDEDSVEIIGRTFYLDNDNVNFGQEKTMTQVIFDESGKIKSQKEIKYSDYYEVGYTDKGRAISIDNKIYTAENPEQPLEIKDNYDLFGYNDGFYLNQKTSKTYTKSSDLALVQIDTKTGEPLYNNEGKEASYGGTSSIDEWDVVLGGFEDYAVYAEFESDTSSGSISAISNEMLPAANFSLPIEHASDLEHLQITVTDDEIHLWKIVGFQHKAALKQFVIGKEIGQPMD